MRSVAMISAGGGDTKKSREHMCVAALKFTLGGLLVLQCFGYMARADAAGTNLNGHDAAVFHCSDLLQVRIPYGTGFVVGVAHIVTEAWPFSTNITFS